MISYAYFHWNFFILVLFLGKFFSLMDYIRISLQGNKGESDNKWSPGSGVFMELFKSLLLNP